MRLAHITYVRCSRTRRFSTLSSTETMTDKALMVKLDYRNSFGEKTTREVSVVQLQ